MRRLQGILLGILVTAGTLALGQDTTRARDFDYSRLKPIVHFFANAEYNPSAEVSKDYSFWIGRMMFGFEYQFDKHWSAKVLIDRTKLPGSMNSMYLKVASLRWTPNDRFALEAGVVNQTNYIPFESFYGYRFVAETFQDRYYGIPSSDVGVIAYYKVSNRFSLDAAITNGEGPRIDQDNFGRLRFAGGLNFFPVKQVQTRIFMQLKSPGETGGAATERLINGMVTYRAGDRARFGADITHVKDYQNIQGTNTYGCTVFGSVSLVKNLSFLVRYDRLQVDYPEGFDIPGMFSQNALISGFSLNPLRGINLCLNYQGSFPLDNQKPVIHRVLFSFEYKI